MKYQIHLALILIGLTGCTDTEQINALNSQVQELSEAITTLESELDDCQNGASKLLASMEIALEKQDISTVKNTWSKLESRHPDAPEYSQGLAIYNEVLAAEEAERIRLENEAKAKRDEQFKALKRLKKSFDDVSGLTWYKQPYFTHYNNTNFASVYIGSDGNREWMRLKLSYNGSDWIFFENAYLSYDGNTFPISFDKYNDKESDNSGGGVWEWIDVTVSSDMLTFLREFCQSPNAKMRLSGKYTETRTLSFNERKGIKDVIAGYDALRSSK